jgi:Sulfotransferase family
MTVFVLTTARSGSSLLGYLLGAHPDIACPAEALILTAAMQYGITTDYLTNSDADAGEPTGPGSLSDAACAAARTFLEDLLGKVASDSGKPVVCVKELEAVPLLTFTTRLFPEARYICLYRHCMDVIASGLEINRWGFRLPDLRRHLARSPDNFVAALARYWLERTTSILRLEEDPRFATIRVRYEDLVTAPGGTLERVLDHIGVDHGASQRSDMVAGALLRPSRGASEDPKIRYRSRIDARSVGRGRAVPAALLDDGLRDRVNVMLRKLGYSEIAESWNYSPDPAPPGPPGHEDDLPMLMDTWLRGRELPARVPPEVTVELVAVRGDGTRRSWRLAERAPKAITVATREEVLRDLVLGRLDVTSAARYGMLDVTAAAGLDGWLVDKAIGAVFGG